MPRMSLVDRLRLVQMLKKVRTLGTSRWAMVGGKRRYRRRVARLRAR